jgi:hypothetical protein
VWRVKSISLPPVPCRAKEGGSMYIGAGMLVVILLIVLLIILL